MQLERLENKIEPVPVPSRKSKTVSAELLASIVADAFCISVEDLSSPGRYANLVCARITFVNLARKQGLGWTTIGKAMGRDHSTAMYLHDQMNVRIRHYPEFRKSIKRAFVNYLKLTENANGEIQ